MRNLLFKRAAICGALILSCFCSRSFGQLPSSKLAKTKEAIDEGVLDEAWGWLLDSDLLAKVENARKELSKRLETLAAEADDADLPEETWKWTEMYRDELKRFGGATYKLHRGYAVANEYEEAMGEFSNKTLKKLLNDVIDDSKSAFRGSPADVKKLFERMKSDVEKSFAALDGDKKKSVQYLTAASHWKPQVKEFQPLHKSFRAMIERTATRLVDVRDRLKQDIAYRTALQGDESDLCAICIQGRIEEARRLVTTWRPVRLNIADISYKLEKFPTEAGWIDVIAHGTPKRIKMSKNGKKYWVSADVAFRMLNKQLKAEHLSDWQRVHRDLGVGLRLLSCNTGRAPDGLAQQLANLSGVKVKAPTRKVCLVRYQGRRHVVLHWCNDCPAHQRNKTIAMHVLKSTDRGHWKTFSPNGDAKKKIRDLLYEKATKEEWWEIRLSKVSLRRSMKETLRQLRRIHPRLDSDDAEEMLADPAKALFMDRLTRDEAIKKVLALSSLGIKGHVQVMSRYKHEFRCVDIQ